MGYTLSKATLDALTKTPWGSLNISYTFIGPGSYGSYSESDLQDLGNGLRLSDIEHVSAAQEQAFRDAAAAWMEVGNVLLHEQSGSVGEIAVGKIELRDPPTSKDALAGTFHTNVQDHRRGDVWISDKSGIDGAYLTRGASGYFGVLHEIGHALGLDGDKEIANYSVWNSMAVSVMSYNFLAGQNPGDQLDKMPSSPMLFDIARIQYLYGANPTNHDGADNYKFLNENGWPVRAIWDAGGEDVIDASDQTAKVEINLNPGASSYVNSGSRRLRIDIAFQPLIGKTLLPGQDSRTRSGTITLSRMQWEARAAINCLAIMRTIAWKEGPATIDLKVGREVTFWTEVWAETSCSEELATIPTYIVVGTVSIR